MLSEPTYDYLQLISSSISTFFCLFVVLCYLFIRPLRSYYTRLVFWLNLSDLIGCLSIFIGYGSTGGLRCEISGGLNQFFYLASLLWITCICFNYYLSFVLRKTNIWKLEIMYHVLCWSIPAATVITILFFHGFGFAEIWCWITTEHDILRWSMYYGPEIFLLVIVQILYIGIIIKLRKTYSEYLPVNDPTSVQRSRLINPNLGLLLTLYIVLLLIIRVPGIITRFLEAINVNSAVWANIEAATTPLQGLLDSFFFFFDKQAQWELSMIFCCSRQPKAPKVEELAIQSSLRSLTPLDYQRSLQDIMPETRPTSVSVFVGTWNLGTSSPPKELSDWIPHNDYDIYSIGTQECKYEIKDGQAEQDWFKRLEHHMGPNYWVVSSISLWDIRLIVFANSKHAKDVTITNIKSDKEATGIGHVLGNKGGVGVSFNLEKTSFCFVNCHLAAHQSMVTNRNLNVEEIVCGLQLTNSLHFDILNSHHHLFWFGDLNYRIDLPREEVMNLIAERDLTKLLEHDQLTKEMKRNAVLHGFLELPVNFPPTYLFEKGSRVYSDKKMRIPSWCDRILFKTLPGVCLKGVDDSYTSCDTVDTSDHAPVSAVFEAEIIPYSFARPRDLDQISGWQIEFTCLEGINIFRHRTIISLSQRTVRRIDPFITMWNPLLNQDFSTAIITNNYNPVWQGKDIPTLGPIRTTRRELEKQHVFLKLRDHSRLGQDDSIGQCVVPLGLAMGTDAHEFACMLTWKGRPCGELRGSFHVRLVSISSEAV